MHDKIRCQTHVGARSMAMASIVPAALRWRQSTPSQVPLPIRSMAPPTSFTSLSATILLKTTAVGSLICVASRISRSRSKLKCLPTQVASKGSEVVADEEAPHAEPAARDDWQSYSRLARERAATGDRDAALEAFEAAQRCLEQLRETESLDYAKISMNIGVLQGQAGRHQLALKSYLVAKEVFVDLKRLKSKNGARLLGNIAMSKFQAVEKSDPNWDEVISAFSSALELFQQQGLLQSKEGVRLLLQAGKAKEEAEDFAGALEDYKAARATLEEAGAIGSKMGIELLEKMSDVQFELDDLEGAENNLVMAVDKTHAKGLLDSLEGAKLLQKLGDLQTELNGYQEALTSYRSARQILEDRKALQGFPAACLVANMATLEADSTSAADGLMLFEEAKKLFVEADALHTEEGADLLVNLAAQCLKAGEVDSALHHLEEAREIFESQKLLDDTLAAAKFWMNLGSALMQKESQKKDLQIESDLIEEVQMETQEAQDAFLAARKALEAAGAQDTLLAVELSALKGQAHIRAGDFEAALEESQQARALIETQTRLQESDAAAQVFYNLGLCYSECEELEDAIASLDAAVASLRAAGPLSSGFAAEVCGALADVYFEAGEPSKAAETYDLACQAGDAARDMESEDLAMLFTKRGLAMAEAGDLEDALKDHEQARSLAEENGFLQSSLGADILVNMGIAKANGDMLEEAVADFEAALEILEETEMLESEMGARVFQDLSLAQKQLGDTEGAAQSEASAREILALCEDMEEDS